MARKTTDGHDWYWSIPRDLARNNPRDFFAIVFWSDQCRDWDASVDVASGDVLRNKMKAIAEARGEPKLTERPILVLPVSKYFASVYKICQAMVDSSSKPGDARNVWRRRGKVRLGQVSFGLFPWRFSSPPATAAPSGEPSATATKGIAINWPRYIELNIIHLTKHTKRPQPKTSRSCWPVGQRAAAVVRALGAC